MRILLDTTEPLLLPGQAGKPGILLIHGFTGTPKEMHWMGTDLNQRHGFTSLAVRLAGHATSPEDMIRSNFSDWLASVEDGWHLLSGLTDRIYLAGLSMGGVLALHAAARLPVRGVIAMATPAHLPEDWRLNYVDWLARIIPYLPKSEDPPGTGWFDQQAWQDHISYPQNPVRAIGQLKRLLEQMRALLAQVTAPALLIYSQDDRYIPLGSQYNMETIRERIGSRHKEVLMLSGSGHVLTRDARRQQVFDATADFIQRMEAQP